MAKVRLKRSSTLDFSAHRSAVKFLGWLEFHNVNIAQKAKVDSRLQSKHKSGGRCIQKRLYYKNQSVNSQAVQEQLDPGLLEFLAATDSDKDAG